MKDTIMARTGELMSFRGDELRFRTWRGSDVLCDVGCAN
jgi:hypothetical protein